MTGLGPGAVWTALLDACVLVPASLRDTLLRFAEVELYRPKWSKNILDETRRNVRKLSTQPPERTDAMAAAMNAAFEDAEVTGYQDLVSSLRVDRKDRHVLAAAIAGRAHVIVTFNLRHFPAEAVEPYEIEVQHPDEFLLYTLDLDPQLGADVIRLQAADTGHHGHPSLSVDDVLAALSTVGVPRFAERIRQLL